MSQSGDLRQSARSGLAWGVWFTLARDVLQFLTMLVMVRLLSPHDYGQQALASTVIGFIAVASLKTVSQLPLQARNPDDFDWDTHFTVGAVVNSIVFVATLLVGGAIALIGSDDMRTLGYLVMVLSPVFLVEIYGTYQLTWLQARHEWGRMRLLLIVGSLFACVLGIGLAFAGWGAFALASMPMFLAIPLAGDALVSAHRPRFSMSALTKYAEGLRFGVNRAASSVAYAGRALAENSILSGLFGFSALGSFTRAVGLAQITSGRIGPVASQTLYSILTRAEARSERFGRFSALLLQGVIWTSVPAAVFLSMEAGPIVRLLYGSHWTAVIPLVPLASLFICIRGANATLNQIMLANLQVGDCLRVDVANVAASFLALAFALTMGVVPYLAAVVTAEFATLTLGAAYAVRGRAIDQREVLIAAGACAAACIPAALAALMLPIQYVSTPTLPMTLLLQILLKAAAFGICYAIGLRILAPSALSQLVDALPMQARLRGFVTRFLTPSRASPT